MTSRDRALWDAEAEDFDAEPDHGLRDPVVRDAWRTLLRSLLPPVPSRVADLGCGTGTLALLLAEDGHAVDGVDFSPEMIRRARAKPGRLQARASPSVTRRTRRWRPRRTTWRCAATSRGALPAPADVLARWVRLLRPEGRLVLIEGYWSTGSGLTAAETLALVAGAGLRAEHRPLQDRAYWGRTIDDERYAVVARL